MKAQADKAQDNKSQSVVNKVPQKQKHSESAFQLEDNRPEAIAQRRLQEGINNSPRARQLKTIRNMAGNSPRHQHTLQLQAKMQTHTMQKFTQFMKPEEEEEKEDPLQGKFEAGGQSAIPIAIGTDNQIPDTIQKQSETPAKNNTGLSDKLKSGIENLSGHSMDDVKVHYNSDKPAQLNAHAYAQGTDIHLGSGQEKHLPHEVWHVVQQKQGRVKPTMQLKGKVNINDDTRLEKEADVMGAKALLDHEPVQAKTISSPDGNVAQLAPEYKAITGITHLVEMTEEGSLYNEDYEENEYAEVSEGVIIQIDTDISWLSRRGPNQEEYSEIDKDGPQHYEWFKVLKLNGIDIEEDVYVREDTFINYSEREALIANMEAMKELPKMQWDGSGAKEFAEWMGEEEAEDPTTANCWNAILYAAYYAGLVDKKYIQRANEGGKSELGPALARAISGSPTGSFLKNEDEVPEKFQERVAENEPDIPRGMVVVLHSAGFHVVLSLGGGQMLELDKQALVKVENPNYNPKYIPIRNKFLKDLKTLERRAKLKPSVYGEKLRLKQEEFKEWQKNNSRDESFSKRMDNELREVSFVPGLNFYLKMLNLDGIYWGPLPNL